MESNVLVLSKNLSNFRPVQIEISYYKCKRNSDKNEVFIFK
jgi:hypothetical protein